MMKLLLLLAFAAAPLAAEPWANGEEAELGASVRANIRAQSVDPAPDYTGVPLPGSSARRTSDAMIRYETGRLKPLLRTNGKTDVGSQGGAQDTPTMSIPLVSSGTPN